MKENEYIEIQEGSNYAVIVFRSPSITDTEMIAAIAKKIKDFISEKEPAKIIFDFAMVKFFSSQVLGLILDVRSKLKKGEGKILIAAINSHLHRVFRITNLDKIFTFYLDIDAALKAVNNSCFLRGV